MDNSDRQTGDTLRIMNHWRLQEENDVNTGISKREIQHVRRWKTATIVMSLVAILAIIISIISLLQIRKSSESPTSNRSNAPRASMQISAVNQSLLHQNTELEKIERDLTSINQHMQDANNAIEANKMKGLSLNRTYFAQRENLKKVQQSLKNVDQQLRDLDMFREENKQETSVQNQSLSTQKQTLIRVQQNLQDVYKQFKSSNDTILNLLEQMKQINRSTDDGERSDLVQDHSKQLTHIAASLNSINESINNNKLQTDMKLTDLGVKQRNISKDLRGKVASLGGQVNGNAAKIDQIQKDMHWIPLYNGYEYFIKRSGSSFNASRKFCQSKGGDLAAVGLRRNETRNYITDNLFAKTTRFSIWIGLSDLETEGSWKWIDGVRATKGNTNFLPGEPNNFKNSQDCSYMHKFASGYKMADYHCWRSFSAICERRIRY